MALVGVVFPFPIWQQHYCLLPGEGDLPNIFFAGGEVLLFGEPEPAEATPARLCSSLSS